MEPVIAAVLHWLVDQTRPARERVYDVVADDVVAFIEKHYTSDVPPITMPTVPEPANEPADPRDAEIARLQAELAAQPSRLAETEYARAQLDAVPVTADPPPIGYTPVLPPEIPESQRELWEKFVASHAGDTKPPVVDPVSE